MLVARHRDYPRVSARTGGLLDESASISDDDINFKENQDNESDSNRDEDEAEAGRLIS